MVAIAAIISSMLMGSPPLLGESAHPSGETLPSYNHRGSGQLLQLKLWQLIELSINLFALSK